MIRETPEHCAAQLAAMERWAAYHQVEFVDLGLLAGNDYSIHNRDRLAGWVEVKCRSNKIAKYPTLMIDESKRLWGIKYAAATMTPAWLVVQWSDVLGWVRWDIDLPGMTRGTGGRTDRDDPADIDAVIRIPTGLFERLA